MDVYGKLNRLMAERGWTRYRLAKECVDCPNLLWRTSFLVARCLLSQHWKRFAKDSGFRFRSSLQMRR